MRSSITPRNVRSVLVVGWVGVLISTTVALAGSERGAVISPGTRVNGMRVVQGTALTTQARLFSDWCDPVVLTAGRRIRSCGRIPRVPRLFVGHGLWASQAAIERIWNASKTEMWIDNQRVNLQAFGWTERTLSKYGPAGNKDVALREWSVTLVGATAGRHTIRYRSRVPQLGVTDTTWTFTVPAR